jgi:polysaccharide biosynthesis PFTS motif protein
VRVAEINLNQTLVHAVGKPNSVIAYHLPPEWREVLREHGFKVAELRSALAWNSYVALHLAYGAFTIARRAVRSVAEIIRPSIPHVGRFAFFHGLARGNLPRWQNSAGSYDILTWYLQWPDRIGQLDTLCHTVRGVPPFKVDGVSVVSVPSAIQPLTGGAELIRYIGWGVAAAALSIVDFLRGHWWHGLMLNEASSAAVMRHHAPDDLARDYLFHNSAWVFRPLWTYEAERLGSRISYYFYSTNCETFKRPEGYPLQDNFWHAMNWPFYMVWDEYQADFVRRAVGKRANISVVGPVWFQAGTSEVPSLPAAAFAVFDVEPHRPSRYQVLGMSQEYFVPETATQFLIDIHEAISECGGTMVLKHKRLIGKLLNRRYRRLVDELCSSDHFAAIDPETAAVYVVESCAAVISMPFTSTALLGRELGKPSVYYDPRGVVQKDDRAAHGIEVLSGPHELRAWVSSVVASKVDRTTSDDNAELVTASATIASREGSPETGREPSDK